MEFGKCCPPQPVIPIQNIEHVVAYKPTLQFCAIVCYPLLIT